MKEVIACAKCSQQLRVPTDRGSLDVTCPKCRYAWRYSPVPAQLEIQQQIPQQSDSVALRMMKELEAAVTARDVAVKAEEGSGIGWVIGATIVSVFLVGWWSILTFVVAAGIWGSGMERRKKKILAVHNLRIAQLQEAFDTYSVSKGSGRPASLRIDPSTVPLSSAGKSPVTKSSPPSSDIGRTIAARAGGVMVGSVLASAAQGRDLRQGGDVNYSDPEVDMAALSTVARAESYRGASHDQGVALSDDASNDLDQGASVDGDTDDDLDLDLDLDL